VIDSVSQDDYGNRCSIEGLAKAFDTPPSLLRGPLRRLKESGLITIEGSPSQTVYPTLKLLMDHNPTISLPADAQEILRRLRRTSSHPSADRDDSSN
jgi:hypothetical protein